VIRTQAIFDVLVGAVQGSMRIIRGFQALQQIGTVTATAHAAVQTASAIATTKQAGAELKLAGVRTKEGVRYTSQQSKEILQKGVSIKLTHAQTRAEWALAKARHAAGSAVGGQTAQRVVSGGVAQGVTQGAAGGGVVASIIAFGKQAAVAASRLVAVVAPVVALAVALNLLIDAVTGVYGKTGTISEKTNQIGGWLGKMANSLMETVGLIDNGYDWDSHPYEVPRRRRSGWAVAGKPGWDGPDRQSAGR
jgi:hypothetical protein